MSGPSDLTTQEYVVRLWQRGLLSNHEAIRALADHCAALARQQQQLLAVCRHVEPVVARWTQCHPEEPGGQRDWAALRDVLDRA